MRIITQKSIEVDKSEIIGNKAHNLFLASGLGFNVPKFLVLTDITLDKLELGEFQQIQKFLNFQLNQKIILRSSASGEDSDNKSFAGIFESVVINFNQLEIQNGLQKIFNYKTKKLKAYAKNSFRISIIVQEYKIFTKSGVAFSLNPTNPTLGILINSAIGQPKAVVDGRDSKTTQLTISGETVFNENNILEKIEIKLIYDKILLVKKIFQTEVDIEFGFIKNEFFLLQVRPITNFSFSYFLQLESSNIRENFPQNVLPLTYSILQKIYHKTYFNLFLKSGVSRKKLNNNEFIFTNLLANFHGQLYYNIGNWFEMTKFLPGSKKNSSSLNQMITGKSENQSLPEKLNFFFKLKYYLILITKIFSHPLTIKNYQKETTKLIEAYQNLDFKKLELPSIYKMWVDISTQSLNKSYVVAENDFLLMALFDIIKRKLKLSELDFQKFISKYLANNTSTEFLIKKQSIYNELNSFSKKSKKENQELITEIKYSPELKKLRLEILDFVTKYSSRFPQELNLSIKNPNPKNLKEFLDTWLKNPQEISFVSKVKIQQNLPFSIKLFNYLIRTREENRLLRASYFDILRKIYFEVGGKFTKLGILNIPEDIHYLSFEEIWDYVNLNSINFDLQKIVSIRKQEYTLNIKRPALSGQAIFPDFYKGLIEKNLQTKKDSKLEVFYGKVVSSGKVEGEVTILKEFPTKLLKEYGIIITSNTDPGWIEIFPRIKGMILENGGILSHASIVCREMNIPCITEVENATELFKNKQKILLDGNQGFVKKIN